jgi:hypothetical protein
MTKTNVWRIVDWVPGKRPFDEVFLSKKRAERIAEECGGRAKPDVVDI